MNTKAFKLTISLIRDLSALAFKSHKIDSDIEKFGKDAMMQGEPKAYSTVLTLQQIRKEAEKKESAVESTRVRCRVCFKEIAPVRRCFGHGGGGGGGSGSGSGNTSDEKASKSDDKTLTKTGPLVDETKELIGEFSSMEGSEGCDTDSQSDEESFAPEIIAELVDEGLLVINNNRESMTLTIKLQCEPNSLSKEQRQELKKFMSAIIKEFNAFKEQHQLSGDCINMIQDKEGNILSLRISLPTLKLYDEFIRKLANNLLPAANPKLQKKDEEAKSFAPIPLFMALKLTIKSKHNMEIETKQNKNIASNELKNEEQELFNPSPFSKLRPR
jgi:hypothetical protein